MKSFQDLQRVALKHLQTPSGVDYNRVILGNLASPIKETGVLKNGLIDCIRRYSIVTTDSQPSIQTSDCEQLGFVCFFTRANSFSYNAFKFATDAIKEIAVVEIAFPNGEFINTDNGSFCVTTKNGTPTTWTNRINSHFESWDSMVSYYNIKGYPVGPFVGIALRSCKGPASEIIAVLDRFLQKLAQYDNDSK